MNDSSLILTVVIVALVIGAVLLLLPTVQMSTRAKRDYRRARGTQHRQQVEQALAAIRTQVEQLQNDTVQLQQHLSALGSEEARELDQALARHLVSTRIDEVPGVGRARIKAISDTVFRGQLNDLHSAHQIPGIGPSTQTAISSWVNEMQSDWTQLRSTSFAGKRQIIDRYTNQRHDLEQQLAIAAQRISELEKLDRLATSEVQKLSRITVGDFRRALKGRENRKDAEDLQGYILGMFPPWDTVPSWYTELLNAAERETTDGRVT